MVASQLNMEVLTFLSPLMSSLRPRLRSSARPNCLPQQPFISHLRSATADLNSSLTASSESSLDNNSDPDFYVSSTRPLKPSVNRRSLSLTGKKQRIPGQSSSLTTSTLKRRRVNERIPESEHFENDADGTARFSLTTRAAIPSCLQHTPYSARAKAFSKSELCRLRIQLLDWYAVHHRRFPWRAPPRHRPNLMPLLVAAPATPSSPGAPYAVWISEVMSQQTRIDVVVSYYETWMKQLPTIEHLADASLDLVYELWAGLGYYRRAKFLHEGAKQIVQNHAGKLPEDLRMLTSIKGIGKYTAGAISSIAFQQPVACVDGNVDRVLSRLRTGIGVEANTSTRMKSVWELAESCIDSVQVPGDFNQALMELGATVCKPRLPNCSNCPVQSLCGAYAEALSSEMEDVAGFVVRYPAKAVMPRCKVRLQAVVALVVWRKMADGPVRVMLVKRKAKGLLEGLWEAPNQVVGPSFEDDKVESCMLEVQDRIRRVTSMNSTRETQKTGICVEKPVLVGDVMHIFSHIRQTLRVMSVEVVVKEGEMTNTGGTKEDDLFRWLLPEEVDFCAVSTQMKKVISKALASICVTSDN